MRVESITNQGGKINEDSMYVGATTFGVFDGATSLDGYTDVGGVTGAKLASSLIAQFFSDESTDLSVLVRKANESLQQMMTNARVNMSDKAMRWSTTAAVVQIKKGVCNWVQTGDSVIVVEYINGNAECLIKDYDHDQDNFKITKKLLDQGERTLRSAPAFQEQNLKTRRNANVTFGVLNGEDIAMNFLNQGSFPLENVRTIYLMTDGFFLPKEDFTAEDNFVEWVTLYHEKGLEGLIEYIRNIEEGDPDLLKYIRFKKHDDATVIVIHLP